MRMNENEDLVTYLERFRQSRNIVAGLSGKEFIDDFVENTKEYKQLSVHIKDPGDLALAQDQMQSEPFVIGRCKS